MIWLVKYLSKSLGEKFLGLNQVIGNHESYISFFEKSNDISLFFEEFFSSKIILFKEINCKFSLGEKILWARLSNTVVFYGTLNKNLQQMSCFVDVKECLEVCIGNFKQSMEF